MTPEQFQKAEEIATRIIQISQNTLLLNLRFMDSAIFCLSPKQVDTTLATDGRYIYYGVAHILKRYKEEQPQVVRDVMHLILHCIFRHSYVKPPIDIPVWDLAADIAVENVISSLNLSCVATSRDSAQQQVLNDLNKSLKSMNAEHIYRYYKDKNFTETQLAKIREIFESDDHSCWYNPQNRKNLGRQGNNNNSDDSGDNNQNSSSQNSDGEDSDGNNNDTGNNNFGDGQSQSSLEKEWEDVSRQIQMDMETFSKQQGTMAGDMMQQLRELNREKYDYDVFLKKFAVMGEAMKINDDEFDYIFYTYGLQLFGNVPLIEPLEYKEEKRIREFVVAIDTSGSTSGDLVQKFLVKTYNILKNSESFFSKINLHIIQCDAKIQEHVKITKQEEFDNYIKNLTIKGLGGTDFRPVFEEVDRMILNGEFQHLKGIIYFTDGYGTFPAKKPDYETAFVFLRSGYDNPEVPPWAIKLILNDEEI